MNEIKKIITLFFVIYAVYSLYVRCQANPGGRSCGKCNFEYIFRVPKYVIIIENVNVLQGVIVRDLEFKPRLLTHHN